MDVKLLTEFSIIDLSIMLLYLVGVIALAQKFKPISVKFVRLFSFISVVHVATTIGYYLYSLSDITDAVGYYRKVLFVYDSWPDTFGQGTYFIYATLYPLVNYLHISYFGSYFVYSFIGLFGYYFILKVLLDITGYKWTNWFYVLLMPMLHFWTVSIGKDSLIFFGISMLAYMFYFNKKWMYYVLPILLIGLIRIHILFFVMAAFGFTQLFLNKNLKTGYKFLLITALAIGLVGLFPFLLERVDFKNEESILEQVEMLGDRKLAGGASINLKDSNLIVRWFSYVFRPFFIDAHNIFAIAASIENLVWVLMFINIVKRIRHKIVDAFRHIYWFSAFSILTITLPGAYLLSNLGVAARQKTMIIPFLFMLLFISLFKSKENNNSI
ncbi:MAG: hypothetical protein K8F54_07650 [Altibacter sp.]|uniref:hypothetical protein n=1 Tax=Altibacter sp. TaxID=2024823 RepID=UPI001E1271FC|nr:hypothetical protein [Altibacter sp.]MBZ0327463.1 hypothetical protein [Altibacter sp.]